MDLLSLQSDPRLFRQQLLIDTAAGPRPLAECTDDWQRHDFEQLDAGWRRAAGQPVEGPYVQRAWIERGRGHSKSSDAMVSATWCLFASRRQLSGVVCAVDKDQAGIDRDHVARLVSLNPWLASILEVQQWRVINRHTGSAMEVMASNVASSYGLLIDFAVLDEISVWPKRDLFDSVLSAVAKKANALLLCIGNAGFRDSWVWSIREAVRQESAWYFSRLEGPVASWITEANLAEQRRLLPNVAFARLWLNLWVAAGGDALTAEVIAAAFRADLGPQTGAAPGFEYVAGLDLGVTRDASAVCVLGVRRAHDGHGRIVLAHTRVWRPSKGQRVNLQEVEDTICDLHARFKLAVMNYDPWEARHLASRLQAGGIGIGHLGQTIHRVPMVEVAAVPKNLQMIATALLESFNDRRLDLYPDADLRRDLERLRVEERSYGFRLTSPRDAHGHGDLGTAFSLAVLAASELAGRRKTAVQADNYGQPGDSPLQRALRRAGTEAEAFRREQEQWVSPYDHEQPIRELMHFLGRRSSPD